MKEWMNTTSVVRSIHHTHLKRHTFGVSSLVKLPNIQKHKLEFKEIGLLKVTL